ncbi:transcription factor of the MADS box [Lunasporangiospora selenospora]|uniref:Transcription factor of the MADS box n=1 Tax=Lunasporangiospora selenospora TaxID=979761 RepID=A0A9P6KCN7_9FUNG|nr:transcription factor of the MADS box [Lunasporangiospora selenospora]
MTTKRGLSSISPEHEITTSAISSTLSSPLLEEESHIDKRFKQIQGDEDDDEDEDDEDLGETGPGEIASGEVVKRKNGKRAGRRKIKIEYIEDKGRRHITFSKRKSGIMKKAYELSTLTGTQVLLLVVSETGLVYTFTTPKLQPLVTKTEGKNLIQACLHAPDKEADADSADGHESGPGSPGSEEEEDPRHSGKGGNAGKMSSGHKNSSTSSPTIPLPLQQLPSAISSSVNQGIPPPLQQGPLSSPAIVTTAALTSGIGYGSSSAMTVPTYPPPYNHIPFPAAAAAAYGGAGGYHGNNMYVSNGQHGSPAQAAQHQYWAPPPHHQHPSHPHPHGGHPHGTPHSPPLPGKMGRVGEN